MTTVTCLVLTQTDTTTMLHAVLGGMRSWRDVLSDCIRGGPGFRGLVLMPVSYVRGRCKRPVYDVQEVDDFIKAILSLEAYQPIRPILVDMKVVPPWMPAKWHLAVPCSPVVIR
jgi:hypothetical protein